MLWGAFEEGCPELAVPARDRLARDQLAMLGTLRKDGAPRISPCEVDFAAGHLFLGMMWRSMKALDLLRDPRIVVHSATTNKDGTDGDLKLYGRAVPIEDASLRRAFRDAIKARIDWAPDEPSFHLFSLDIDRAAYIVFPEGGQRVMTWNPERGLRRWNQNA